MLRLEAGDHRGGSEGHSSRCCLKPTFFTFGSVVNFWRLLKPTVDRAEAATPPAAERSPNKGIPKSELGVYYPGMEDLGPDEMRIVALGTGMPSARPKQAAACWLVELGNGV